MSTNILGGTGEPRPRRYEELFLNPAANPFGIDTATRQTAYEGIYRKFRGTGPHPPTASTLLEEVRDLFEAQAVGGVGIFVNDARSVPRLHVIHGIRKYPGSLLHPSTNTGKTFGYLNDIVSGRGELVQVTASMFSLTRSVRVYTTNQHRLHLEAHPDAQFIDPLSEDTPHTEEIKCRHTFFLPFEMIPLVLNKNLSPRQAFFILQPWLAGKGLTNSVRPLLDALRVASTHVSNEHSNAVCEIAANEPGPLFRAEADLSVYMDQKVLYWDLPGLVSVPSVVGPETAALTAAVSTLTDNQLKANEANERRRAEESKPPTMEEIFGDLNTKRLMSLCLADTPEQLPPVYQGWSKKKKGEKLHALFQSYVDTAARELSVPAPFVPTAILKTFQTFQFYGIDECEIGDGILPMAFAPPGGSPTARKKELADAQDAVAYDTIVSTEGNSISLSDAQTLGKAKGYVPVEWTEAVLQIEGYLPVLATLTGMEHPIVRSYLAGLDRLKRIQLGLRYAIKDECGDKLAPAIVVYYFQIRIRGWLEEQWESTAPVEVPSFIHEFRVFKLTKTLNWLPVVSDVPALQVLRRSNGLSATSGTKGSKNNSGNQRTKAGSASTNASSPPQTRVENPHYDSRLSAAGGELGTRLKSWKISKAMGTMKAKGKGPCLRNDGKEMCHSWRAKGFCYESCKLSYDHTEPPEDEADRFWEWCQEAYGTQQ